MGKKKKRKLITKSRKKKIVKAAKLGFSAYKIYKRVR